MENELTISKEFKASLEKVYEAWTNLEALKKWWPPAGLRLEIKKLEVKPQGIFHYKMFSENNFEMWAKFCFLEIVPKEKITFSNSFCDEEGVLKRHPLSNSWPLELLNQLTFQKVGELTKLELKISPLTANEIEIKTFRENFEGMQKGFAQNFEQLTRYLS